MTASRCACARVDGSLGSCPGPHGAAGALEHGRRPDALADGRPLRRLTVVDPWRRQSPLLEATARQSGVTISAAPDRSGSRSCANHKHRLPRDEVSGAGSGGLGLSPQGGSSASCAPRRTSQERLHRSLPWPSVCCMPQRPPVSRRSRMPAPRSEPGVSTTITGDHTARAVT